MKRTPPTPADKAAAERLSQLWRTFNQQRVQAGQRKMTQDEAGDAGGIGNQSSVWQHLSGHTPLGLSAVLKWANLLGVDPRQIRDDIPELNALIEGNQMQFVEIKSNKLLALFELCDITDAAVMENIQKAAIAAGSAVHATTDLPVGNMAFGVKMSDESAAPDLNAGDTAIVDPAVTPTPGALVVATVRRDDESPLPLIGIYKLRAENQVEIAPINQDFPTYLRPESEINVLGVVVEQRKRRI